MWDMRVGMSFAQLDSIAFHDQQAHYTCTSSLLGFRTCSVPLRGLPGRMDALVDSAGRVVELTFWTGSDQLVSSVLTDGGSSYRALQMLYQQSLRLAAAWRGVTASDTVYSEDVGWTETWLEGPWIARIVWQGTGQPSMITTADAEESHAHALALAQAESGASRRGPTVEASGSEEALRSELRRLVRAQRAFRERTGRHADGLASLHFVPREGILVEIVGARSAGWWARAWTGEGGECEVWDGVPPPREADFEGQAGEPACS
jgi:hypothetical protein